MTIRLQRNHQPKGIAQQVGELPVAGTQLLEDRFPSRSALSAHREARSFSRLCARFPPRSGATRAWAGAGLALPRSPPSGSATCTYSAVAGCVARMRLQVAEISEGHRPARTPSRYLSIGQYERGHHG